MRLWNWLETWFPPEPSPTQTSHTRAPNSAPAHPPPDHVPDTPAYIGPDLPATLARLRAAFAKCSDLVCHELTSGTGARVLLVYVSGLVDRERIERDVVRPILSGQGDKVPATERAAVTAYDDLVNRVLAGDLALIVHGQPGALLLNYRHWEGRSPEEPKTEPAIRGPRDGFTETLRVNTALLRRRLRSTHFKLESLTIGELTRSDIVVAYLENVASPGLIAEVKRRLQRIRIDGILESGYLEEFLEDHPASPFSQVQNTERPDVVAAALLEGRAAILTDGTPFALIVPTTFMHLLQAHEDYYERFWLATALRWLRYLLVSFGLLLPSVYIAFTTYHPEMIPANLLVTLSRAREGLPFPAWVETFMMEVAFEALREAGIRLPKVIGPSVSIVGGLVIGEAAVQAGIVSTPLVVIVALTGIASFTIPRYNAAFATRLLRFPLMLLAASLGVFGIMIGLLSIALHVSALRSFGTPYMTPLSPFVADDIKDVLAREPRWAMRFRPRLLARENAERIPPGQAPTPPSSIGDGR